MPNELEKLITLAKVVARPWVIATYVLAGLLALSVVGNVYLATSSTDIILEQENNNSDFNVNQNNR